ncbi:uncharacterized oxidoreductase YtbE-like isoform X2 [Zerene cesonia]|uniref:uncharacterized oxidoreductase YtbE-like isoform X2 n=1 Tax=Zerene cesonia TaxID=33412 RepID=UPI0018E54B9E|nr:uncharacterized oxidoreductase YtbE-like isoform X2 [Zerene cesonia]
MAMALPATNFGNIKFALNNGVEMPAVGIGTYRVRTAEEIYKVVDTALGAGYRLFDTAGVYGNEVFLGQAFRTLLPKYQLDREDIFITSKLAPIDHGTMAVPKAFNKSLNNLGMEYIDMYLIHFPGAAKVNNQSVQNALLRAESWRAMVKLYDEGRVNTIGVSNYTISHLSEFLENHSNIPVINQVEFHPFFNQTELLEFCKSQFIGVQAYCSFGGLSIGCSELFNNAVVTKIAAKHEASPAQVLLLWALQQDISVIPKSTNPKHIKENIQLDFRLTNEEMKALNNLSRHKNKYAWDSSNVR